MRSLFSSILAVGLTTFALGCGTSGTGFDRDGGGVDSGLADGASPTNDGGITFGDTGTGEGGGPCVGLACQQTCATTSISGYVYDPKGTVPLYNVFVYVPNAPLSAIPSGVTCTACQAPASGSPLVSATTDETGHFQILNAPVGTNIPLVMQLGKWRREVTLPNVQGCEDNHYNTKASPKDSTSESLLRMPKKQAEGSPNDNIPLIAVTTGALDYGECFLLNTIGIAQTEFDTKTTGRVQIYNGEGGGSYPNTYGNSVSALFDNSATMNQYDLIFTSCEGDTYNRGTGYANAHTYLDSGGRFFGTHYMYNFFADQTQCGGDTTCQGNADFNSVATWAPEGFTDDTGPFLIDQTFPKGKSMATWLHNIGADNGTTGQLSLYDTREDVAAVSKTEATRWIYSSDSSYQYYLSFNAPTTAPVANQCGRAVFSDVHVAGTFTGYCKNGDSGYAPNLAALEFLFFDLSSCVQNDTQPPVQPPVN